MHCFYVGKPHVWRRQTLRSLGKDSIAVSMEMTEPLKSGPDPGIKLHRVIFEISDVLKAKNKWDC